MIGSGSAARTARTGERSVSAPAANSATASVFEGVISIVRASIHRPELPRPVRQPIAPPGEDGRAIPGAFEKAILAGALPAAAPSDSQLPRGAEALPKRLRMRGVLERIGRRDVLLVHRSAQLLERLERLASESAVSTEPREDDLSLAGANVRGIVGDG